MGDRRARNQESRVKSQESGQGTGDVSLETIDSSQNHRAAKTVPASSLPDRQAGF